MLTFPGIGRATAFAFAEAGCKKLAICDLNATGLAEIEELIQEAYPKQVQIVAYVTNTANEANVKDFISATVNKFGVINYAVNCAGIIGNNERSTETSMEEFDRINGINYRGTWLCSREELRVMLGQEISEGRAGRRGEKGCVVNVASQLGIVSRPTARELLPRTCDAKRC